MGSSKHKVYTESYSGLCHGTSNVAARSIVAGQSFRPSKSGWCGSGIYFYDIKAKAYWSAGRTCRNTPFTPVVVFADIQDLPVPEIADLRTKRELLCMHDFMDQNPELSEIDIDDDTLSIEEKEKLIHGIIISYYAKHHNKKLVIGLFSQIDRDDNDKASYTADILGLGFGMETIYCVKDGSILSNIRMTK